MSLGTQLAAIAKNTTQTQGETTLVNGIPTLGIWAEAQAERIQMYITESMMHLPAYEVALLPETLSAPFSIAVGSEVTWGRTGWKFTVRHMDIPGGNDTTARVRALCLAITR